MDVRTWVPWLTFTGLVRGEAAGAPICAMTLEHYPGMTEAELQRIESEARQRFGHPGLPSSCTASVSFARAKTSCWWSAPRRTGTAAFSAAEFLDGLSQVPGAVLEERDRRGRSGRMGRRAGRGRGFSPTLVIAPRPSDLVQPSLADIELVERPAAHSGVME